MSLEMWKLVPSTQYSGDGFASSSVASSSPYHCQMNWPIGVRACGEASAFKN